MNDIVGIDLGTTNSLIGVMDSGFPVLIADSEGSRLTPSVIHFPEKGNPIVDAALAGARLRLRPILMTAFAFILGCVPLWKAAGSGAASRQILGTTVIGGMLAATLIAIFIIPVMFYLVEKLSHGKSDKGEAPPVDVSQPVGVGNKK